MTEKHPKEMLADGASLHQTHHLPKVRFSKWSRLKNLKLAYSFIIWQNILQPNIEYFIIIFNENYIICYLIFFEEAGFSEEWNSTNEERSRQRQVEVQANITNNPNRPAEYRTVTAPQAQSQQEVEAEERTCDHFISGSL